MKLATTFLPYQRKWIADRSGVKVYEKSRRIGISWTEAFDRTLAAATEGRGGMDSWYTGYNKEMALEFVEDCAFWARKLSKVADAIEETVIEDIDAHGNSKNILAYRIRFASWHKVVALSSRPSNLRGKDGCATIDEAAFHDDLPGLLKAALAFQVWGGEVHIISTHNGENSAFNEMVTDIRAGRLPYSLHRTTFDEALSQGLYERICKEKGEEFERKYATRQDYRASIYQRYGATAEEELDCIPSAGSGVFLPSVLIEARMKAEIPVIRWEQKTSFMDLDEHSRMKAAEDFCAQFLLPILETLDPKLMSCFGEDFGRSGDLTVIWPLQFLASLTRRTPFVVELRNIPFNQQRQILFFIADRLPRFQAGAMDARGNGQYLAEQAAIRYGKRDTERVSSGGIEQVMLTIDWYRDNMPRYKAAFEDASIELPKDAEILSDHRALVMEKGVARVPERKNPGEHGSRHGDSAIAGALAYYATTLAPMRYGYTPAPRKTPFDERMASVDDDDRYENDERVGRFRRAAGWFGLR